MGVVLHVAPHPDDELIGAPATLMALRDAGWTIVNLAYGLGRSNQRSRREVELREACRLAGFELRTPPSSSPRGGGPVVARAELGGLVAEAITELDARIVGVLEVLDEHLAVADNDVDRRPQVMAPCGEERLLIEMVAHLDSARVAAMAPRLETTNGIT